MTKDEKTDYCAAMVCYLCTEKFNPKIENCFKVKDHCRY